jgi:hypothetical protein
MPNQEQSKDGVPRKDPQRPSPDVERDAVDGQSDSKEGAASGPRAQDYRGDGPGKMGLTSDKQPDLVAPSGVNERDHGAADDKPMGGGAVNLDDDDMAYPRGKTTAAGGTAKAEGGDSAPLGPPREIMSDRNGPSDPDNRRK